MLRHGRVVLIAVGLGLTAPAAAGDTRVVHCDRRCDHAPGSTRHRDDRGDRQRQPADRRGRRVRADDLPQHDPRHRRFGQPDRRAGANDQQLRQLARRRAGWRRRRGSAHRGRSLRVCPARPHRARWLSRQWLGGGAWGACPAGRHHAAAPGLGRLQPSQRAVSFHRARGGRPGPAVAACRGGDGALSRPSARQRGGGADVSAPQDRPRRRPPARPGRSGLAGRCAMAGCG